MLWLTPIRLLVLTALGLLMLTLYPAASSADSPPSISDESASGIASNNAKLEAQINPQSSERFARYQFQVVADTGEFLSEFACPTEGFPANTSLCIGLDAQAGALPIDSIPAGVQDQSVSLDLAGAGMSLQPGTTYHYRVLAARGIQTEDTIRWEDPIVYGGDQTFTTPASPVPSIESESASSITPTDATLEARIDPNGFDTMYRFRVVASPCHANPLTCELATDPLFPSPAGQIAAASGAQTVSVDLAASGATLDPGREYHYAVFASNSAGPASGPDRTFVTGRTSPPVEPGGGGTSGSTLLPTSPSTTSSGSHRRHHKHKRRHHRKHHHHKHHSGQY